MQYARYKQLTEEIAKLSKVAKTTNERIGAIEKRYYRFDFYDVSDIN